MLRSQWLHKEPTQVVPGCLWPESFQAVGPGPVGGLPRREFLLLGAALGPAMYHFQKVYFWGLPHRLCWKDRTAPQRVHRETINTAKEVSDCRGMGTSSNSEQPVSLMKCFSVYKGQTEEEIKSTRWERRRNIEHGSIYNTRGWQNQGSPGMKNELIWSKTKKILWRKEWLPTPVFLPGKSHGQRSLAGYSSWCCKELDTTERLILSKQKKTSHSRDWMNNGCFLLTVAPLSCWPLPWQHTWLRFFLDHITWQSHGLPLPPTPYGPWALERRNWVPFITLLFTTGMGHY